MTALTPAIAEQFATRIGVPGFAVVKVNSQLVQLDSTKVSIILSYYARYHELEATLLPRDSPEHCFSLTGLLRLRAPETAPTAGIRYVSTPSEMEESLSLFADLLRVHCMPLLEGNPDEIRHTIEALSALSIRDANERSLKLATAQAIDAWNASNFARVVQIYRGIRDQLSPNERKRFEIARRKAKR